MATNRIEPRHRPYLLAGLLVVAAIASLAIDVPAAWYARRNWLPGDLRKLLDVSEVFAHGMGVALILWTVYVLDPARRHRLLRVVFCAFAAGIVVQLSKYALPRIRPQNFDFDGGVWETFVYWRHAATSLNGRAIQSFPSGHTATAVGLAWGLAWLYPRGRWLFTFFAVLAAAQRIESAAHYVSDTLVAAAAGCLIAGWALDASRLGRRFDHWEGRWADKSQAVSSPRLSTDRSDGNRSRVA